MRQSLPLFWKANPASSQCSSCRRGKRNCFQLHRSTEDHCQLRTEEEIAALPIQSLRRRADKFELADLAVVDQAQGEAWRISIRKFIVIAGAPGTGKTTTAIKRIGQKTDPDALIRGNEVTEHSAETLKRWLQGPTGWAFFTPSELLRNYLHEALAKEVVVTEEHVPVWAMAKEQIARDVLRFIGQDRFMSLRKDLVATCDSKRLTIWTKNLFDHFKARIQNEPSPHGSEQALDSILRKIPIVYQEYRLREAEAGNFYHASAMGGVNDKRIDPIELDCLIYTALKILRDSIAGQDIVQRPGKSITQRLINEFRYGNFPKPLPMPTNNFHRMRVSGITWRPESTWPIYPTRRRWPVRSEERRVG